MTPPRPGFVHPRAEIGNPPEHRDWPDGEPGHQPFIHPTAQVNAFVTVDAGRLGPTTIGPDVFLMAHVHVGHDCIIGQGCELAAGVVLSGEVKVGRNVKMGVNCCVRPCITIGDGAQIGAGAVVVKDVEAGTVVAGSPARVLEREMSHP